MWVSEYKDVGGIYKITNKVNGKCYIGRTTCFNRRSKQYLYDIEHKRKSHVNDYMLKSITKHGFQNFTFTVIEICDKEFMEERELFWMDYYSSYNKNSGYNLRRDSEGVMVTHPSTSKKISNRLRKEWRDGVRSEHSEKMKLSWESRSRVAQSLVMTRVKTKYYYILTYESGDVVTCSYSELKELGMENCIGSFHRKKSDECTFKGVNVKRVKLDD